MSTNSRSAKVRGASTPLRNLRGQALLSDMLAYQNKVTASPSSARDFLVGLGVLTRQGKAKRLIRG